MKKYDHDINFNQLRVGDYAIGYDGILYQIKELYRANSGPAAEVRRFPDDVMRYFLIDSLRKLTPKDAAFLILGGAYDKV